MSWGDHSFKIKKAESFSLLNSNNRIISAVEKGQPIVGRIEIKNPSTKMKAIINFPVKTININERNRIAYQVDTGPVLFPDLSKKYERSIESFRLAFVAFSSPTSAEFIIEKEVPVGEEYFVHHYSKIEKVKADVSLFAIKQ